MTCPREVDGHHIDRNGDCLPGCPRCIELGYQDDPDEDEDDRFDAAYERWVGA